MKEEWSFKQYEVFAKEKRFRVVVFPNVSVTEDLYLIASVQSAADGFRCNPA